MEAVFLKLLNMSLTGSYVILAVLLVRLLLKKAPKKYSFWLWLAPAFRLVCPVTIGSVFSLFSLKLFTVPSVTSGAATTLTFIPQNIGYAMTPQVDMGISGLSEAVNSSLPAATPQWSVNPMQLWIFFGTVIWCIGMGIMLLWAAGSLLRLCFRLRKATLLEKDVYECENVRSPFILGIFAPKIYMPYGMEDNQRRYVLAHERCHIRKWDHFVKLFAYCILVLHWFNPLCWIAYYLMNKDMEMRCDENVLSQPGMEKTDYSMSLLAIASNRRFPCPSPLAFAESSVKMRIKNILKWKQPKTWVRITAEALCLVCLIGCGLNPAVEDVPPETEQSDPTETKPDSEVPVTKKYVTDKLIYLTPLVSFRGTDDNGLRYLINEESIAVIDRNTGRNVISQTFSGGWEDFPFDEATWKRMIMWTPEYEQCSVDFIANQDQTKYRYVDETCFLLKLYDTIYICDHTIQKDAVINLGSIYSLKAEEGGRDAFGVADPVVEFGIDRLSSLSRGLSNFGITVTNAEIMGIRQIPTGTVNEIHSINLFALEFRLSADVPEEAIGEDGIVSFSAWGGSVNDWQEYPESLRYEDGWLVPVTQTYILLEINLENGIWTQLRATTEADIQHRFATEEMLESYGDVYTAAAMELYFDSTESVSD